MSLFDIIITAVNAIFPVLLLVVLGFVLKKVGFLSEAFSKVGNKLVFHVGLPVMLFVNIYDIENLQDLNWQIIGYAVAVVILLFVLGYAASVFATKDQRRRGVILQCSFRSNYAIIGLPLAGALGGSAAIGVAAILSSVSIPLYNVLAVVALTIFVSNGESSANRIKNVIRNILKNPLIWGVLAGIAALGIREMQLSLFMEVRFSLQRDLKFLYSALSQLKSMTTPLALIVLGAQFEFSAVGGLLKEIVVGTMFRTVIAPILGIGIAIVLNTMHLTSFGPVEFPALIALYGSPVAVSSAIMAGSMGNDEQLATQLVVWTSLASILTIFIQVCILLYMGLLAV